MSEKLLEATRRHRPPSPMLRAAPLALALACFLIPISAPPSMALEIDPSLQDRLEKATGDLDLLILLADAPPATALEPDLRGLGPEQRRQKAVKLLKEQAARSQSGLLERLEAATRAGEASRVRGSWLAQCITLRGGRNLIDRLGSDPTPGLVIEDAGVRVIDTLRPSPSDEGLERAEHPSTASVDPNVVWSLDWIRVPEVWQLGFDGSGILIGHIDTGAWMDHPDLAERIWTNPGEIAGNGIDDDANGYVDDVHGYDFADRDSDPTDDAWDFVGGGHGTHTAGTVVGDGTSGLHTGVAPGAKIIVCKPTYTEIGTGTFAASVEAMEYAVQMGARLLTMSLGAAGATPPALLQAERRVGDGLRAAGVPLFTSAGNAHQQIPAPYEVSTTARVPSPWHPVFSTPYSSRSGVIAVGATGFQEDTIWEYSSQGPVDWGGVLPWSDWDLSQGEGLVKPDISAPGHGISSLLRPDAYSQTNWSGTSMSCPHAAGVAALMLQKNPSLSMEDLDRILQQTAVDAGPPGRDNQFGAGRIDALAAVQAVPTVPMPSLFVSAATILDDGGNGTIEAGEAFELALEISNNSVETEARSVAALVYTANPKITVLDGSTAIESIPVGATATHLDDPLRFVASPLVTDGEPFELQVFLAAQNGYTKLVDLSFEFGLPKLRNHSASGVRLTVTDLGTLGWWNLDQLEGAGFGQGSNDNLLYIGGLWGGNGPNTMSNRDYVPTDPGEWSLSVDPNGRVSLPQIGLADEHFVAVFHDGNHPEPLGVQVTQHSLAWSDPDARDFVILRYEIENTSGTPIDGYRVGLFTDWDFLFPFYTRAAIDASRRMAYMTEEYVTREHAGVSLLEPSIAANVSVIHNPTYVHPNLQLSDSDKWGLLEGSIQQLAGEEDDEYSTVVAAGPFDIAPGEVVSVAFAVVYGVDLPALNDAADRAAARYAATPTAVAPMLGDGAVLLNQNAPNPFNPSTTIEFELSRESAVRLGVFDLQGRRVRALLEGSYGGGRHAVSWDGTNDQGRPVVSGTYLYRIETDHGAVTRKMILLK